MLCPLKSEVLPWQPVVSEIVHMWKEALRARKYVCGRNKSLCQIVRKFPLGVVSCVMYTASSAESTPGTAAYAQSHQSTPLATSVQVCRRSEWHQVCRHVRDRSP